MRKTKELAKEIAELNMRMTQLRETKKSIEAEENDQIIDEGITRFRSNTSSNEFRLLGHDMRSAWNNEEDYKEYFALCTAFDKAMDDIKRFYKCGKHIPIIERLILWHENYAEKRDLLKIFKNTWHEKTKNGY